MPPVYPVDLPTPPQNVSPRTPILSFDQDLERGPISFTEHIDHPLRNDTFALQPRDNAQEELTSVQDATLVSLPSSEELSSKSTSTPTTADLLQVNSHDNVEIPSIEPAVSSKERVADPLILNTTSPVIDSPVSVQSPDGEVDQSDPDKTIRLVGGGGVSGVAVNGKLSPPSFVEREVDSTDGVSNSSGTSINSRPVQKTSAKHEKRMSLSSGLKMFRQSSAKQKSGKDSITS